MRLFREVLVNKRVCSMGYAVWGMQYGVCSMGYAVWGMQYGVCSMGYGMQYRGLVCILYEIHTSCLFPRENMSEGIWLRDPGF